MIKNVDIAIIGAGPAGAACALALHNTGLKVTLIDKAKFPRDKICGDAIPGPAFKVMDKINKDWGAAMRRIPSRSIIKSSRGFTPKGRSITFNWKGFTFNSPRLDFDNFLFDLIQTETGTTIIQDDRVADLKKGEDHINLTLKSGVEINAKLVIGCDGANSITSRKLAKYNLSDRPPCSAVRTYYSGVTKVEKSVNEFHFFNDLAPGYFWIFPVSENTVNVGLGLLTNDTATRENSHRLRQKLESILHSNPNISPRFKEATQLDKIKGFALPLGINPTPISGDRFMLCGDAASLISPLLGHGIDTAMISGLQAAEQAKLCFQELDFSSHTMFKYDKAIDKEIRNGFKKGARILKLLVRFPNFLKVIWFLVRFDKTIKWAARVLKV